MLRVIDLTSFIGAYAARLFAEQGHEVIRVEPLEGDELRRLPPFLRDKQDLEHGAYHQFLNSGKKSVTVDVESDTGKKILHNLLGQADVLLASTPFDEEGVATRARTVVRSGVLEGYFLGCYSARKLGLQSTGSAGGNHNLVLEANGPDFRGMLRRLHRGLLVTELLGHGVNLVTGDYSRGAAGYWVENGEIAHPVEEVTIAGNLKDMFRGIEAVGSDTVVRGSRRSGSILVREMTIAGE